MRNPLPIYLGIMTAIAVGVLVLTAILLHIATTAPASSRTVHKSHQTASQAASPTTLRYNFGQKTHQTPNLPVAEVLVV